MDNFNLNYIIEEGNDLVKENLNHHLPLPFRNRLLKTIGDKKIIGRLSILCALKVYPLWKSFMSDDAYILQLLYKAEQYVDSTKDENILLAMAGKMKAYVTNRNDEEHFSALYAGYSAVNATYEVTGKDISEMNFDDFEIDSYDWDSAFYACLAYNGGASSLNNVNKNKTKEFWEWYLNEGIKKAFSKEPLVNVKENIISTSDEFIRPSLKKIISDPNIESKINKIQDILITNSSTYNWEKICLATYIVDNTIMSEIYYYNDSNKIKMNISYNIIHKINDLAFPIKNDVFKLSSGEGSFYYFQLTIIKNKDRNIQFIFDKQDESLKSFDDSDFAEDFVKYPRKKEYTPDWLQKILKREKVNAYL